MDKTISLGTQDVPMEEVFLLTYKLLTKKMGYGDVGSMGGQKQGLGVQTGLDRLDRVLNRDNSTFSKSLDKNKNWRPGQD